MAQSQITIIHKCAKARTCPARLVQVGLHAVIVGEDGSGGSNLSSHVADGGHACIQSIQGGAGSKGTTVNVQVNEA